MMLLLYGIRSIRAGIIPMERQQFVLIQLELLPLCIGITTEIIIAAGVIII